MSNDWDYVTDPDYDPAASVPTEGIVGAYALVDGQRTGDLHPNPAYQPSVLAKMLNRGNDPIVTAYANYRRGLTSKADLLDTIAASEVIAFQAPTGQPYVADVDGGRLFQVFTSQAHLRDVPEAPTRGVSGGQIAQVAALGITIEVNPHPEGGLNLTPDFFTAVPVPA